MNIADLFQTMATDINSMTMSEKLIGGGIVTLLSMAVVFIILFLLQISIQVMARGLNPSNKENEGLQKSEIKPNVTSEIKIEKAENQELEANSDEEICAVIAAAVASSMGVSQSDIRIKNIKRVGDQSPAWAKAGRIDQMTSVF